MIVINKTVKIVVSVAVLACFFFAGYNWYEISGYIEHKLSSSRNATYSDNSLTTRNNGLSLEDSFDTDFETDGFTYSRKGGKAQIMYIDAEKVSVDEDGILTVPEKLDGYDVVISDNFWYSLSQQENREKVKGVSLSDVNYVVENNTVYSADKTDIYLCFFNDGEFIIPEGVKEIKHHAFANLSGITSVSFPQSLKASDAFSFSGCTGLSEVHLHCAPEAVDLLAIGTVQGETDRYKTSVITVYSDTVVPVTWLTRLANASETVRVYEPCRQEDYDFYEGVNQEELEELEEFGGYYRLNEDADPVTLETGFSNDNSELNVTVEFYFE